MTVRVPALWRRHQSLPRWLRVQWLAPLTVLVALVGGAFFTLPPGPLCDEGMVLFMEGGCDYGPSNVFFFAKASLLLVLTWALPYAARRRVTDATAFVPHFLVAAFLIWAFRSGGRCDSYYDHPNGSIGQMVLELSAFAALGLLALPLLTGRPWSRLVAATAAWHALAIAAFYLWLTVFDHWTWAHSLAVAATLIAAGTVLRWVRVAPSGRRSFTTANLGGMR